MKIPTAIDPDQIWTIDFCSELARMNVDLWRKVVATTRTEAAAAIDANRAEIAQRLAAAEAALVSAEARAAEYVPGSGPRFILGHVPGQHGARIAGMVMDAAKLTTESESRAAHQRWAREVVRWVVRDHVNLRDAKGETVPFDGREVKEDGHEPFTVPTDRQLAKYAPFLSNLASVCIRSGPPDVNAAESESGSPRHA